MPRALPRWVGCVETWRRGRDGGCEVLSSTVLPCIKDGRHWPVPASYCDSERGRSVALAAYSSTPANNNNMKWCFAAVGALFLAGGVRSQFLVEPSTKADPNTIKDCTWWHVVASGDTCALIESSYSVTHQQFTTYVSLLTSPTFCSRLALNSSTVESIPGERLLSCRGQLVLH